MPRLLIARSARIVTATAITMLVCVATAWGQVSRIVIDSVVSPAFGGASYGTVGQYETIAGRAFGELDPKDSRNAIITDLKLAPRNANGKVEYTATFFLVKPINLSTSSHLLWHDVPNRGSRITIGVAERDLGDIGLSSGWQGDQMGGTAPNPGREYAIVPRAKRPDGSPVTGRIVARVFNVSGPASQPLYVYSNPMPYPPQSLDTRQASLTTHASETVGGEIGRTATIPAADGRGRVAVRSNHSLACRTQHRSV